MWKELYAGFIGYGWTIDVEVNGNKHLDNEHPKLFLDSQNSSVPQNQRMSCSSCNYKTVLKGKTVRKVISMKEEKEDI